MQETLAEIDKDQDVILDYIKDQELKAKWQEVMKKKAAENQLKLDAAKATISILTTIAGQIDPDFAKGLNTVATSTLQVGMAINGWLKAVSGLKGLNKIASLSTVVMTGNVVGAVMNVVGLFTPDKPTPEQQILEEIGKLRQQVDELRVEMHARFDRIDVELNAIYTTMHDRFDQIDIQLGKINGNIGELQQSLLALDLKLSRIERNNFEFLNALGRRPLLDAINGGLGYAARTGQPMPFQPEFVEFENVLHSWGTIHAFDPLNAGPTQRDFSDGQMLAELSAFPLDSNINYLNGWLMAHGLPGVTNKRLPSPRDWLFASRAYMQLALEWPEHMKQIDPQRQTELDAIGVELEAAMRGISTQVTAASPQANSLLFSTVITQYQDKLDAVDSSLQALETAFMNEVRGQRLQRNEPFDLYGGVDQPLTYAASEVATATCGDAGVYGSHPAPGNLKSLLPNFARYNLADYLHLGKLNVCISYAMGDPIEQCYTEPEPPHAEICDTYYDVKAVVTTYFDNVSIMSQTIEGGGGYQTTDWYVHYGELEPNWTQGENFKAQFEALTTVDVPSPELAAQRAELLNTTTNKLETALGGYQQEMYARILNEMTKGSLAPLAVEAAGSKALLDSFVTLGLPRAAGDDEFLHAMLYGNQQLVDDGQIMQSYALSLTQPITGTGLLVNPRLVIGQVAAERSTAFTGMVNEYLDAITAQTHSELPDYIANTRRALDLTMRIVQLDVPVGPTPTPPGPTPTPPGPTPTPTPPTPEPSPSNVHRGLLPFLNR